MSEKKYRVHDWDKWSYSQIRQYIDENHTDMPLRNDEIVDLLNEQHEYNLFHIKIIENQQNAIGELKERIKDLEDLNRIYVNFMVSHGYELSDVMKND